MLNDVDCEHTKQLIIHKIKNMDLVSLYVLQGPAPTTTTSSSVSLGSRMFSLKRYLHSADIKASTPLSAGSLTVDSEIVTFVNLVRENGALKFQSFWKAHSVSLPRLSKIARIYNVVPATSAYLEQMFSVARAMKNIRRASLLTSSLRNLLMLKNNNHLDKLCSFVDQ